MPTKHTLEQQLEECRADLEAEIERHNRTRDRENQLTRDLKDTRAELDRVKEMADRGRIRALELEAEASRLRGHLEGIRYMIRLEKGLEPHDAPLPDHAAFDTMADFERGRMGR